MVTSTFSSFASDLLSKSQGSQMKTSSILHKNSSNIISPAVKVTPYVHTLTYSFAKLSSPTSFTHGKVTLPFLQLRGPFAWGLSCFWEPPVNSMIMRPDASRELCTSNTNGQAQKEWLVAAAAGSSLFTRALSLSQYLTGSISVDLKTLCWVSLIILLSQCFWKKEMEKKKAQRNNLHQDITSLAAPYYQCYHGTRQHDWDQDQSYENFIWWILPVNLFWSTVWKELFMNSSDKALCEGVWPKATRVVGFTFCALGKVVIIPRRRRKWREV